jgi:hypothetical protein
VVGRCTALQQLLMASNRLRGLTSGIGNLMRLQVLDLSHNQYRHLPTMTGDLTQLQVRCRERAQLREALALNFLEPARMKQHGRLQVASSAVMRLAVCFFHD